MPALAEPVVDYEIKGSLMKSESSFAECIAEKLSNTTLDTLQVNVGRVCNLSCQHCHLTCGPHRSESMSRSTMEQVILVARSHPFHLIDITGGAPELNQNLPFLVEGLCAAGRAVQVRTNLVALLEGPHLIQAFKNWEVSLVASLPCYLEENVQAQRGDGVYDKSVECLRRLNKVGYGIEPNLPLALVYNPGGAFLPAPQAELEATYRQELRQRHGIEFTCLYAVTNLPIGRFAEAMRKTGEEQDYLELIRDSFNPKTITGLMCRHQICVDWDGKLYDCDFNLALGLPVNHDAPDHIKDFDAEKLSGREVVTDDHCFGCTAGAGSSCGGSLT